MPDLQSWQATLAPRLGALKQQIPASVQLLAVTKTIPISGVQAAYTLGLRDFGESKVQEAIAKQTALRLQELEDPTEPITWHLIGHLQTNKARKAVQHFDWIHSVDSLKLAEKLDQAAQGLDRQPRCCLQVKLLPDPNKFGFAPDELRQVLPQLDALEHLKILGLMTVPPLGLSPEQTQALFEQTRKLGDEINQQRLSRIQVEQFSMGMSGDFLTAIAAGATIIRLGTALFGARQ